MRVGRRVIVLWATLAVSVAALPLAAQDWRGQGRLEGVVKNEEGETLQGVEVTLGWGEDAVGPAPLTTNKRGRWSFLGLRGGEWDLHFAKEGYVPAEATVNVSEVTRSPALEVTLRRIPEEVLRQEREKAAFEHLEEGNALLQEGKYAEARATYETAMAELEEHQHPSVLIGIARTHYQEGDKGEAIASLERALEIDPDHVPALKLISSLLSAEGERERAREYMERIPAGEKLDPDSVLNVGIELYNQQDLEGALEQFNRVVADYPELAEGYYYRGLVYLNQDQRELAKADFEKLLELDPDHEKAAEARQFLEYLDSQ